MNVLLSRTVKFIAQATSEDDSPPKLRDWLLFLGCVAFMLFVGVGVVLIMTDPQATSIIMND
jgi:hypothetical protein